MRLQVLLSSLTTRTTQWKFRIHSPGGAAVWWVVSCVVWGTSVDVPRDQHVKGTFLLMHIESKTIYCKYIIHKGQSRNVFYYIPFDCDKLHLEMLSEY